MTDELRRRLARLDPLRPDSIPAIPPADLLEQLMTTTAPATAPPDAVELAPARRRWRVLAAATAAAAAVALGGVGIVAFTGGPAAAPLALTLPGGDSLASCLVFDAATLAQMPVAFEGRAVDVGDGQVTLDVTRWYRGGDADQVTLTAAEGGVALIDGIEFSDGGDYLVTATDGQVNFCGYSAVASDELREVFAEAFGG